MAPEHEASTARRMGWERKQNGELLNLVEAGGFDAFLTTDRNLKYQQNLSVRRLRSVVMTGGDDRFETLAPLIHELKRALTRVPPGELGEVSA